MEEYLHAGADSGLDSQRDSNDVGSPVLYRQISYEELEECVLCVRDSISEFYLAPQGEISFAAVEAALKAGKDGVAIQDKTPVYSWASAALNASLNIHLNTHIDETLSDAPSDQTHLEASPDALSDQAHLEALSGTPSDQAPLEALSDAPLDETHIEVHPDAPSGEASFVALPDAPSDAAPFEAPPDAPSDAAPFEVPPDAPSNETPLNTYQPHTASLQRLYRDNIQKMERQRRTSALKYAAACFGGAISGGVFVLLCIALILPAMGVNINMPGPGGNVGEVIHTYEIEQVNSPIEAIYEKVSRSIVGIRVTSDYDNYILGRSQATSEGSGIIIHQDGYILTNNRVITPAITMYAQTPFGGSDAGAGADAKLEVMLPGEPGVLCQAQLVARDAKTGLAVIKVEATGLSVAELGDSDGLRPGEAVIAIGSPGGQGSIGSVTDGIVSGLNRGEDPNFGSQISMIQTSAAINSLNSGGALVNTKGQVIGINVIRAGSYGADGLSFAIPINYASSVADSLIAFNYVRGRAKTGVRYSETFDANYDMYKQQYPDIPRGAYVEYVEPLSGAFIAGIRVGDIVTNMGGWAVGDYEEALRIKEAFKPGDKIEIEIYRDGVYLNVELELAEETGDWAEGEN